jgi:hypothetical protein
MDIELLIKKVKKKLSKMTKEERRKLLIDAKILTEDGEYHPDFFTKETVEKSKKKLKK